MFILMNIQYSLLKSVFYIESYQTKYIGFTGKMFINFPRIYEKIYFKG